MSRRDAFNSPPPIRERNVPPNGDYYARLFGSGRGRWQAKSILSVKILAQTYLCADARGRLGDDYRYGMQETRLVGMPSVYLATVDTFIQVNRCPTSRSLDVQRVVFP